MLVLSVGSFFSLVQFAGEECRLQILLEFCFFCGNPGLISHVHLASFVIMLPK